MLFWFISTIFVFLILFCIFQLDNKYAWGRMRELVKDWWGGFLILNIIPLINLLVILATIVVFIIVLIVEQLDDKELDGEAVIKKIFFIKDEQQ